LKTLQGFGIGRLATMIGVGGGAAAVLIALLLRLGGEPMSLLYSNVDLKEAGQITSALDTAGIKYELKGDGSTILAPRDKVAQARLLLSGKGLPTSGSVGYEIFDNAPALGQTDFVQTLNRQRALEGELARTIKAIRGVSAARVHLVLPKRQLFEEESESPSASIMVAVSGRPLTAEQVRAIRNLTASAVPNLKADHVTLVDEAGDLLAGGGEDGGAVGGAAASGQRAETEERIRKTVKELVEGVVGVGKARVQVSADLDTSRVTLSEEKFDPDGQVVRSTQTSQQNANETKPSNTNAVSASQNLPGAQGVNGGPNASSTTGENQETTNYEISKTTRTEVQEPGRIKKLSVAVAVDGATARAAGGKPGAYSPRSAQEMQRIEQLVRSAVGFDQARGDVVSVVNVRFDRQAGDGEGVTAASPFSFDKNDVMRAGEVAVMAVMVLLIVLFVVRPMLKPPVGTPGALALAGGIPVTQLQIDPATGQPLALSGPGEDRMDISRIEGQVKTSSIKQVAEFVEKHPEESVSILRSWLHEA
jgi:flagellar M-ring protein FliF